MYKRVLLIINLILAFSIADAQVPTGVPQLFGGRYYQFKGYVLNDSGLLFTPKDTASRLTRPGIVYRSADSLFYYWNGRRYQKFSTVVEIDPTVSAWAKSPVKPSYSYGEISGTPSTWPWAALTGVPSSFQPSAHSHIIGDVSGLQTALDSKQGSISLTTTGASGSATFSGNTLNVPTYTLAGLGGEPSITSGTTAQYWRGDKSWQTLNTTAVAEGTNLYYTDTRARASLSFTAGSGAYNSSTGAITIPTNTNQLTNGAGYITGNQSITLSGDVAGTGTTAITTTIGANRVTNAMLAQVATGSFLGRVTAATGNVETLTGTQATTLLDNFTASLKGLVPASGGGTTNFLRADGTWAAPPGGGSSLTINTNANNRILTANGGTSSIDAETGLTYDGTTFGVTGDQTLSGNLSITSTGSTTTTPKLLGMSGFASGEAARWQFGDALNSIQNSFSGRMIYQSYWGMVFYGGRQVSPTPIGFQFGNGTDPSATFIGTIPENTVVRVDAATGQTGNLSEWRTSTGTVLASVSSSGAITGTDLSTNGAVSFVSTSIVSSGSALTIPAGVYRIEFDPASVISSYTLTLPASPSDGQRIFIKAGRQIAAGAPVVTSFTVSPNSGQTIYTPITPTTLNGGDTMEFEFESSTSVWTRIK